jgi:hypothetical protein
MAYIAAMTPFDYGAPAELFISKSKGSNRRPVNYRRFATGAEAIRFAIEELPATLQGGTVLEAGEERFDLAEIRSLYDSPHYPLARTS